MNIGIVASRFNQFIVEQLMDGALDALKRHGIGEESIVITWVPGAFELPLLAEQMAASGRIHAVIALGAVVRGDTPHFDYVAGECARGIREASQRHGIPVAFGVLTTDNVEQALERAGSGSGNKGFDVAMAAIETANALEQARQQIDDLDRQ
jgi:6,7-dimethyl-8-ribityllumazine synthase